MGSDGIYGGKGKSKRCVFRYLLKAATELAEQTDSRRPPQRDGAQERKAPAPAPAPTPGTDKPPPLHMIHAQQSKQFCNINGPSGMPVSMEESKVKEMCLQMFLKGSN